VSGDVRDDVVIDSARTMEGVSTASEERRRGELPSRRLRLREAVLRRPGLWLAVLVAAAAAVIGLLRARGPVVPVAVAVRTDLEQHLVASGRVRTVARVELLAQIAGRVASVHVEDGDRVAAGALLVRIDDAELRAEAAQARAAVAQAAGRLENLRNQTTTVAQQALKQSEAVLAFEEAELARLERLAAAGAVPPVDVDAARRRVAVARAERDAAAAKLEAAGPDGAERRVAESALRESRARLDAAEARLAHTRVTAPQAGTVLQRAVEPGDTVRIGDVLVVMAADGPTQLVIEPDERNLAWIRPGQRALVAADAHPEAVFEATVCHVAPAVDASRGTVEVRLCAENPPPELRPDMTVSVDLTVASKSRVLTVPSDAVRDLSTPGPWVLGVENGRLVRRDVKLGIRGSGSVEVVSGLDEGALVVASPNPALRPGQRVRTSGGAS